MNNLREPDDESTTYVSGQPGAPLPAGLSEDTIIGASIPGSTADPEPASSENSELTEFVRRTSEDVLVEAGDAVDESTIIVRPNNGVAEATVVTRRSAQSVEDVSEHTIVTRASAQSVEELSELTITGDSVSDDDTSFVGRSPVTAPSGAPSRSAPAAAPVELNEPDVDREILKSFDPLADNENLRVQKIRATNTVVDPSSIAASGPPKNARIKTPQTAQQLFKKNQARRKQQRTVLIVFMVVMAAVGGLAAFVATNIVL
jgi:hypothetical protein